MPRHIHAPAAKRHTLELKAQSLFERLLAGKPDGAARAEDAVPGQALECVERPDHLSRRARESGDGSHLTVRGNLPSRNPPDHVRKYF